VRRPRSLRARLLRAALRLGPEARRAFVRRACRGDLAAARTVLEDLREHDDGGDPFTEPLVGRLEPLPSAPVGGGEPLDLVGRTLDRRYVLRTLLGRGSSGAVFAATDLRRDIEVAVKLFARRSATDDDAIRREVAVLRGLALPGVVPLLDDGDDGGWAFVVMPRLDGRPFPGRPGPCTWRDVETPALGLLETLARIHAHGVVHRDLKPANVLVDARGVATVLDVGASGGPEGVAPDAAIAGTRMWMAPEQAAGRPTDARADLHGFALLVVAALTGTDPDAWPPRPGGRRPAVGPLAPGAPATVVTTLDRCLEIDPSARFADAHEVLAALRGALGTRWDVPGLPADDPQPRGAAALRTLFAGCDRLHHLPEDAARELWLRTEGRPRAVVRELGAWERAGLARREGSRFVVTRGAIARLTSGAAVALPGPDDEAPEPALGAHPRDDELLSAAVWAGPGASADALAAVVDLPASTVALRLAALRERGRMRTLDGDRHLPVGPVPAARWPQERQRALRRRLVEGLPVGAPGRLASVALVGSVAESVDEVLAGARGDPVAYVAGLSAALRSARTARLDDARLDRLLRARLGAALSMNDDAGLEAALREIDLARGAVGTRLVVRALARAALAIGRRDPARALALLDELALPDDDPSAGDLHRIRLLASRLLGPDAEARAIDAATAWAAAHPDEARDGAVHDWRGWRAFGDGRYEEAARLHEERAALTTTPLARVQAFGNAALAWTVALEFDRAEEAVARAAAVLGDRRAPTLEAVFEYVRRAVAYRRDAAGGVDVPLVEAVESLGSTSLAAQILLTEAAIAWRADAAPHAVRLARAAAARWRAGRPPGAAPSAGAVLADALAAAAGGPPAPEMFEVLVAAARACTLPAVRAQALGLLALADPTRAADLRDAALAAVATFGSRGRECRREVLSPAEVMAAVADRGPSPARDRPPAPPCPPAPLP